MLAHYFSVSPAVQDHSRAVARVAGCLGSAFNARGRSCDLDLLTAAGLLHDICKGQEDHAGRAAEALREAGFPEVAEIVAEHVDLDMGADITVNETSLLYLTDKIVQGDGVISLDARRSAMLEKHSHDASIQRRITTRLDTAKRIQSKVEDTVGRSLEHILEGT
jgi:putative nucleotidyltransferase with HDIG domain